ncbi:MAG: peptidylprolyl isomerase [Candidatus Coatesbacteria bacterium]|mgnify:CR=1 FL=1
MNTGRRLLLAGVAASLPLVVVSLPLVARAAVAERIVARVNKDAITLTEWEDAVQSVLMGKKPAPTAEEQAKVGEQVLDRLISERLIVQAAEDEGLKVTDSEVAPKVEEEIDALRSRFATPREFDAQMRKEGISIEDLRIRISTRLREQYMYFKELGRKQRELEASVEVSDDEVKAYYETHKTTPEWQTAPQVRARHMLFAVDDTMTGDARKAAVAAARKKLVAAQAALVRGEKFENVARSLSEDSVTRESGGDLGTFARGAYHAALEKAAFSLKAGKVSAPIETPAGLHLLVVEEILASRARGLTDTMRVPAPVAGGAPEMQEMTLDKYIRTVLKNQKLSAALQAWVDGLKARALITKSVEAPQKP